MTTLSKNLVVKGELRASEDLTIEGQIDGPVTCETFAIVLAASADVRGDVIARDITVFGRVSGQLIATEIVDVRAEAVVNGHVMSRQFILNEGAAFNGRVEPQHLEAALRVAKFRRRA